MIDNISDTDDPLIIRTQESVLQWVILKPLLDGLRNSINQNNHIKLRELLIKAVPLFNPQYDVMDVIFKEQK